MRSAKDGCSPQGQCGCCTVLVDDAPRVACVTPLRRVAGRRVETVDGLTDDERDVWVDRFLATGASQCGFCTPGIVCRLVGHDRRGGDLEDVDAVGRALAAHLCRCTGWQTIVEAATADEAAVPVEVRAPDRLAAASRRATLEGRTHQRVGADIVTGGAGFADDTAPADALVAVAAGDSWVVADTLDEARRLAGKVQGRRSTLDATPPIAVPVGDWDVVLQTGWVEPAYLETDASWCKPGGEPATSLANGGAFGAKTTHPLSDVARRLADEHGRAVRVLWSREDTVRLGPKRPPLAAGLRADGTGIVRVARAEGIAAAVTRVLPGVEVEELDLAGPPVSAELRAAGWAEAEALAAAVRGSVGWVTEPAQGSATASFDGDVLRVTVRPGAVGDAVVLRSYVIGAAHMAYSLVTSERLAVDAAGDVHDLTIRSFGVVRAADTPAIEVVVDGEGSAGAPRRVTDAAFAAVCAAVWIQRGRPGRWPTG